MFVPTPQHRGQKKLLILDIDETMIHCLDENDPMDLRPELVVRVPLDEEDMVDGDELTEGYVEAGINVRPHLIKMI